MPHEIDSARRWLVAAGELLLLSSEERAKRGTRLRVRQWDEGRALCQTPDYRWWKGSQFHRCLWFGR